MNKTNYIILALILCFSIAFVVVYPLRTFATLTEEELAKIEADLAIVESVINGTYTPPPSETPTETPSDNGGNNGGNGGEGSLPPSEDYGYYFAIVSDSNGTTSFLNPVPKEDAMADVPTDLKIGEKWTGPSGQTYIATAPASTEPGAEQINSILNSTLVPVDSSPDGGNGDGNGNGNGNGDGPTPTPTTPDADCGGCGQPACPVTPPPVTPQYRCNQCKCQ